MKNYLTTCSIVISTSLILAACQTAQVQTKIVEPKAEVDITQPESPRVVITPLPDSGIKKESQPLPNTQGSQNHNIPRIILPEQTQQHRQNLKDGKGVAAYEKLMQDYLASLRQNDLDGAESYLIQAQRIAPQSSDVYRELARLANLKKQGASAEAFARKGLSFAQTNAQRKQLWQQILQSAQLRNNASLIQQAQQNIARY